MNTTHAERRRASRGSITYPPRAQLIEMILGSYREMPGLLLYAHQAARLFAMDRPTCQDVLDQLVAAAALRVTPNGQYTCL